MSRGTHERENEKSLRVLLGAAPDNSGWLSVTDPKSHRTHILRKMRIFSFQLSQCLVSFPGKARHPPPRPPTPPLLKHEQRGKGQQVREFAFLRYNSSLSFTKKPYSTGGFPGRETDTVTILFLSRCLETFHTETDFLTFNRKGLMMKDRDFF